MRITIEPTNEPNGIPNQTNSKVIIESQYDDLDIYDVWDLIRGALIAYGFSESTVDKIEEINDPI